MGASEASLDHINTCSRRRFFPNWQAALIHQSGVRLKEYQLGVEVILHSREVDGAQVCTELSCGELHAEIGLWFAGRELTDFDGAFFLPHEVAEMLREVVYKVDEDFFS